MRGSTLSVRGEPLTVMLTSARRSLSARGRDLWLIFPFPFRNLVFHVAYRPDVADVANTNIFGADLLVMPSTYGKPPGLGRDVA